MIPSILSSIGVNSALGICDPPPVLRCFLLFLGKRFLFSLDMQILFSLNFLCGPQTIGCTYSADSVGNFSSKSCLQPNFASKTIQSVCFQLLLLSKLFPKLINLENVSRFRPLRFPEF